LSHPACVDATTPAIVSAFSGLEDLDDDDILDENTHAEALEEAIASADEDAEFEDAVESLANGATPQSEHAIVPASGSLNGLDLLASPT